MKPLDKMGFKPTKEEAPEADESEEAAGDILAAIAAKDAKALGLALQRHYAHCEGSDDAEEEAPGLLDEED